MKHLSKHRKKEIYWCYAFIAAPILGFLIFGLIPIIASIILSFTRWDMLSSPQFVGIDNYRRLLGDQKVWQSLYNSIFLLIGIPIGMFAAMILAVMMNRPMKGMKWLRTIYYIPVVTPAIAAALLWQWMLNTDYGIINNALWNVFGIAGPNWLGDPTWVKPSLIIVGFWAGVGGTMVLYLAGLQGIPRTYYEAAEIDGASSLQKFTKITFPLLSPIHFFVIVMGIIGTFQSFGHIYILASDGGPQYSGATLVFYIFEVAFQYFNMGYASAVAWILGIIVFLVTLIQFKLGKKWVYQQ